jgi:MspA
LQAITNWVWRDWLNGFGEYVAQVRLVNIGAVGAAWVLLVGTAVPAPADPAPSVDPGPGQVDGVARVVDHAATALPPQDPAHIDSAPPASSVAPDGWTLTVGAKDEVLRNVSPLTTAVSSREYDASGVYTAMLRGPDGAPPPHGMLEVGYQIGCGIESSPNGVTMGGSAGITPSIGLGGIESASPLPEFLNPIVLAPVSGSIAVGLRPGIVTMVPVARKEFTGFDPWVSVSGFHVKVDSCVGESFIRSYAVLTHSKDQSDSIQGYYGTTRKV